MGKKTTLEVASKIQSVSGDAVSCDYHMHEDYSAVSA